MEKYLLDFNHFLLVLLLSWEKKKHLTQSKTEMSNFLKKMNIYSRSVAMVTALRVAMASLFEAK